MPLDFSGFALPHAAPEDRMQRVLQSSLQSLGVAPVSPQFDSLFWDATYFGLERVKLFQEASPEIQAQILVQANRNLLEEIYWFEQAGVGYMAKMLLLADTFEERSLYGLFVADEASHLAQIRPFLGHDPEFSGDTFLSFIVSLLDSADKALLQAVIQVVLEGWGLSHYRSLAKHCLSPELQGTLQGFLDAEARHHATGVIGLQQYPLSSDSLKSMHQVLSQFLQIIQVGPQRLLHSMTQAWGDLSRGDRLQIVDELDAEHQTQAWLNLLKSLMVGAIPDQVMQQLEEQGSFTPYPSQSCV